MFNILAAMRPMFRDEEIALVLSREDVSNPLLGIEDGYTFDIYTRRPLRRVGYVSLRLGESPELFYLGHIGYRVEEEFRGHGYAGRACELIVPLMRRLGLRSVCITADPDNLPSRRTCEKLGCELESIVAVPSAYRAVCAGSTHKCRYILRVQEEA
ncbi:MAG: GNAT family N-acetyltransferase [Clostridia bacterium]|nr:GNAT family N-acetyltransferase [Clostridia bacterium]